MPSLISYTYNLLIEYMLQMIEVLGYLHVPQTKLESLQSRQRREGLVATWLRLLGNLD